jgi:hypothetical protein
MTSGPEIAQRAKEQLAQLTGHAADTVSALRRDDEGWHVTIDVLEMKYVPDTRDVLATYETLLDEDGTLLSYQRTRRYIRGEVGMEEA